MRYRSASNKLYVIALSEFGNVFDVRHGDYHWCNHARKHRGDIWYRKEKSLDVNNYVGNVYSQCIILRIKYKVRLGVKMFLQLMEQINEANVTINAFFNQYYGDKLFFGVTCIFFVYLFCLMKCGKSANDFNALFEDMKFLIKFLHHKW